MREASVRTGSLPRRRHASRGLLAALAIVLVGSAAPAHAGLTITATFDSSITSDPNAAAIESTINTAIQTYENTFSNNINVSIYFQEMSSGLGESVKNLYFAPYNAFFRSSLATEPASANVTTALANLPNTANNPVNGNSNILLSTADIKALGGPSLTGITVGGNNYDGQISLNTSLTTPGSPGSPGLFSLLAVAEHEIDEVLGLGSGINFIGTPTAEDLYRYAADGSRSWTSDPNAQAFFSLDGSHMIAQFDNQNDGGDWGDWQSNPLPNGVAPKVQDAFATVGSSPTILNDGGAEITALNVIGYTLTPATAVPEPSSLALLGCGALTLSAFAWRKRKAA